MFILVWNILFVEVRMEDVELELCEIGCVFVLVKFYIKLRRREKLNLFF